ncbi:MAG: hypothetical protein HZC54_21230 [Verrucomicrobia bacterium]|nr:hypothetical protein [Verrucomicrobiota bacterium]
MTYHSFASIAAFAKGVASLFGRFTAELLAAGYDAAGLIASLNTAAGFLGKDTPEADEARRLRENVANQKSAPQVAIFVRGVAAYLTNHTAALVAHNYNPAAKITELSALATPLEESKGVQEQKKNERGDSTTALDEAKDTLFADANKALDGAIGLFPDDSEFVAEARRIRSELYGPDAPPAEPPAPPPQPPAPPAA